MLGCRSPPSSMVCVYVCVYVCMCGCVSLRARVPVVTFIDGPVCV
jgi:hypothetical protein